MTLAAVLCNPPLTLGASTRRRVELATQHFECEGSIIVNMFGTPSRTSLEVSILGETEQPWLDSRAPIASALGSATTVLLAYGKSEPTGEARIHFRSQVDWLRILLLQSGLPVWQVGEAPRHPSRWQRFTSREYAGIPFAEALGKSFRKVNLRGATVENTFARPLQVGPGRAGAAVGGRKHEGEKIVLTALGNTHV